MAEEKKKSKASKMYSNPPRAERGEDGNMSVTLPEPADKIQSGTDGVPAHMQHEHEVR